MIRKKKSFDDTDARAPRRRRAVAIKVPFARRATGAARTHAATRLLRDGGFRGFRPRRGLTRRERLVLGCTLARTDTVALYVARQAYWCYRCRAVEQRLVFEAPVPVRVYGMLSKQRLLDLVCVEESLALRFDTGTS